MDLQQTIRARVSLAGIGLHSGVSVRMPLSPAAADTGILCRSADGTFIPATPDHVVDTRSATTVGAFGVKVRSIEHLMAAVSALGIDNLLVDVDAEEIPATDGSAKPFVELLYSAGRVSQPAPREPLAIPEPIRVGDESRWLQILPSDSLRISYTLDNRHPAIGLQVASLEVTETSFVEEIAAARTYGFLKDVPMMRQNGLARGGSLDNAVACEWERASTSPLSGPSRQDAVHSGRAKRGRVAEGFPAARRGDSLHLSAASKASTFPLPRRAEGRAVLAQGPRAGRYNGRAGLWLPVGEPPSERSSWARVCAGRWRRRLRPGPSSGSATSRSS